MDFNRYCRFCGQKVEEINMPYVEERLFKCDCLDRPLSYKEAIPGFIRDARITQLKAMHDLMTEANDENIYMTWIYRMPDCPSVQDFIDIAMDDEEYNACFDLFVKLIAKEGNRY